ncbi:hypothetical protein TrVE_jg5123 [Triparma verrucosa]|uniref:N-acetyltransferase domain-containing protein n=2 Tax=Triparma TaxID=722752 RepID=A0A9W7BQT1_9STRA|nr:hypothetical protein TrVE_jg5123 [Triparma verrucosa]GMH92866.1 hypothetical protein TrST_g12079 [Triparma strigata]
MTSNDSVISQILENPILGKLVSSFTSLPRQHVYGMIGGTVVFVLTIATVIYLLVAGGTFKRIHEQEVLKKVPQTANPKAIVNRSILLEDLADARAKMLSSPRTSLSKKLMSVTPDETVYKASYESFVQNFGPSSNLVPGSPQAAVEGYSRGVAGQISFAPPNDTLLDYARSYGGVYSSLCSANPKSCEKYEKLWAAHPEALVGNGVHILPCAGKTKDALVRSFIAATDGSPWNGEAGYDSTQKVWAFKKGDQSGLGLESPLFREGNDNATLFAVEAKTEKVVGLLRFEDDSPENLTIRLSDIIFAPSFEQSAHQVEAVFLTFSKIFALGYRRISCSCDDGDVEGKKRAERLGFTFEGTALKSELIEVGKDALVSRNICTFAILNSDWNTGGARNHLFKKLYGAAAFKKDTAQKAEYAEQDWIKVAIKNGSGGGGGGGGGDESKKMK